MLATPNGHKKVIVLLTDGVPTFSYQVSKVQTETNGSYYGTQLTNRQDHRAVLLVFLTATMLQTKEIPIN